MKYQSYNTNDEEDKTDEEEKTDKQETKEEKTKHDEIIREKEEQKKIKNIENEVEKNLNKVFGSDKPLRELIKERLDKKKGRITQR